ncbi:MAG: Uma2 family endonuclease [Chloroflexi bacterium]|nr:Uma2 family endonuclease [Chloroflexota bacterium]
MASVIQHPASEPTAPELELRLFTIDEVEAMVRQGIIGADEHVELIEGQIVKMNPQGTGHIWAVTAVIEAFAGRPGLTFTTQGTLQLAERSGPEPDLVILRAQTSRRRRPRPRDALLVVEVANTSLGYDRRTKATIYARADIPEYWIVDLNGERIEVYTEPSEIGYRVLRVYGRGERITPGCSEDVRVDVSTVLGPVGDAEEDDDDQDNMQASEDGTPPSTDN